MVEPVRPESGRTNLTQLFFESISYVVEKIVIDIFTALLGIVSIYALIGVVTKITLSPPKVWDDEDSIPGEVEELSDFKKIRKENPHI